MNTLALTTQPVGRVRSAGSPRLRLDVDMLFLLLACRASIRRGRTPLPHPIEAMCGSPDPHEMPRGRRPHTAAMDAASAAS
jgi:hypothetical protein